MTLKRSKIPRAASFFIYALQDSGLRLRRSRNAARGGIRIYSELVE